MSKTQHIQLSFEIPDGDTRDLCVYALGEAGFQSFEEDGDALRAYIPESDWNQNLADTMLETYLPNIALPYKIALIPAQNWNELWERNYPNIYLDKFCQIIPSFRQPESGFEHTLIIDPKMAFGTGHHSTTQLMMWHLRELDCKNKQVMDMGCGTGILGILAAKLGASHVLGIDIDAWCVENTLENAQLNGVTVMDCVEGGAEVLPPTQKYEIFIANINRNILVHDAPYYLSKLKPNGDLLLSGFYEQDIPAIRACYEGLGMKFVAQKTLNDWAGLRFSKPLL